MKHASVYSRELCNIYYECSFKSTQRDSNFRESVPELHCSSVDKLRLLLQCVCVCVVTSQHVCVWSQSQHTRYRHYARQFVNLCVCVCVCGVFQLYIISLGSGLHCSHSILAATFQL